MAAADRARIANAIKATLPARTGGTTAGRPTSNLGNQRVASAARWQPQGEAKSTQYAQGLNAPQAIQGAPAPSQAPMPWDVAAANQENSAQKLYEDKETGIGANWYRTQQEYGLDPGFNDYATNPYSQAAKLQRSYDQAKLSSVNSYAARGHLYSGALVGRQEGNERNDNEGFNSLRNSYAQAQAQKVAEELGAEEQRTNTDSEAAWKQVQAGIAEPLEPQTAPEATKAASKQTKSSKRITAAIGPGRKAR